MSINKDFTLSISSWNMFWFCHYMYSVEKLTAIIFLELIIYSLQMCLLNFNIFSSCLSQIKSDDGLCNCMSVTQDNSECIFKFTSSCGSHDILISIEHQCICFSWILLLHGTRRRDYFPKQSFRHIQQLKELEKHSFQKLRHYLATI